METLFSLFSSDVWLFLILFSHSSKSNYSISRSSALSALSRYTWKTFSYATMRYMTACSSWCSLLILLSFSYIFMCLFCTRSFMKNLRSQRLQISPLFFLPPVSTLAKGKNLVLMRHSLQTLRPQNSQLWEFETGSSTYLQDLHLISLVRFVLTFCLRLKIGSWRWNSTSYFLSEARSMKEGVFFSIFQIISSASSS